MPRIRRLAPPRSTWRLAAALALGPIAQGCIVIPIADFFREPALVEQTLVEGAGFFSKEKIALVDLDGLLSGHKSSNPFISSEDAVAEMKAKLARVRADPEVRAVVLRISSPGGEATACDVIHREVRHLKEERAIPIIASIGDIGASGGYYVACAADAIHAHPTSIVGSIGVIFQHFELPALLEKIGVASRPVKSSEGKDIGSPFREMTPGERTVIQKLVDDLYARFLEVVQAGRPGLSPGAVRTLADGRVVSGSEALALGLVDRVGYLAGAIKDAESRAGIRSPTIVRYTRSPSSGANVYTAFERPSGARGGADLRVSVPAALLEPPRLYYLWSPGS